MSDKRLISIRCSEEEYEQIKAAAAAKHIPLSTYCRMRIMEAVEWDRRSSPTRTPENGG